MSKNLITPEEIIEIALDKDFLPKKIKPNKILISQINYIKPVLTEKLYERVCEEFSGEESELSENIKYLLDNFIKPALAYFVVYEIIPETFLQITNKGGQKPSTEFSGTVSKDERNVLRDNFLNSGNTFMGQFTEYMNLEPEIKKENYPEYEKFCNIKNRFANRGGIIFTSKRNKRE